VITKYIIFPEHGKYVIRVEEKKHVEYVSIETALCPSCSRRLIVQSEGK